MFRFFRRYGDERQLPDREVGLTVHADGEARRELSDEDLEHVVGGLERAYFDEPHVTPGASAR